MVDGSDTRPLWKYIFTVQTYEVTDIHLEGGGVGEFIPHTSNLLEFETNDPIMKRDAGFNTALTL